MLVAVTLTNLKRLILMKTSITVLMELGQSWIINLLQTINYVYYSLVFKVRQSYLYFTAL